MKIKTQLRVTCPSTRGMHASATVYSSHLPHHLDVVDRQDYRLPARTSLSPAKPCVGRTANLPEKKKKYVCNHRRYELHPAFMLHHSRPDLPNITRQEGSDSKVSTITIDENLLKFNSQQLKGHCRKPNWQLFSRN